MKTNQKLITRQKKSSNCNWKICYPKNCWDVFQSLDGEKTLTFCQCFSLVHVLKPLKIYQTLAFFKTHGKMSRKRSKNGKNRIEFIHIKSKNFVLIILFLCFFTANTSLYAHYVFNTLDKDHTGMLSFEVSQMTLVV